MTTIMSFNGLIYDGFVFLNAKEQLFLGWKEYHISSKHFMNMIHIILFSFQTFKFIQKCGQEIT